MVLTQLQAEHGSGYGRVVDAGPLNTIVLGLVVAGPFLLCAVWSSACRGA